MSQVSCFFFLITLYLTIFCTVICILHVCIILGQIYLCCGVSFSVLPFIILVPVHMMRSALLLRDMAAWSQEMGKWNSWCLSLCIDFFSSSVLFTFCSYRLSEVLELIPYLHLLNMLFFQLELLKMPHFLKFRDIVFMCISYFWSVFPELCFCHWVVSIALGSCFWAHLVLFVTYAFIHVYAFHNIRRRSSMTYS